MTWGKKTKEDITRGPAKLKKKSAARLAPQVEKRKLRSQREPDNVSLLESKRARSKSKSPPSVEGVRVASTQGDAREERSIRDPPRGHDQVSTMIIFGRLFEAFPYLDGVDGH